MSESQAMTPEERELVVNVLRNYCRDHIGDPEFGAWPQLAHGLAGRFAAPATQRDDTAELVEALEAWAKAYSHAYDDPLTGFEAEEAGQKLDDAEAHLLAALAKWKERS